MSKNKQKHQHNQQYQNGRVEPVEVYCRIRPMLSILANTDKLDLNACCLKILDEFNLVLQIPECSNAYKNGQIKQLVYSFHRIFNEASSQKEIFEEIGLPLVRDLLNGKNGLLFTYGVTGSGKTYSMLGNQQNSGLLQRSLDTLFNSISFQQAKKFIFKPDKMNSFELLSEVEAALERQQRKECSTVGGASTSSKKSSSDEANGKLVNINDDHIYAVFISCVEIYNNYIYDLLDTDSKIQINNTNKESKYLKEDARGCMYIKDIVEVEAKSTEEALDLMQRAQKRRVVAYTDLNAESSRSHSIFTIRVVQVQQDPITELTNTNTNANKSKHIHVSQLSLVDLAGSERTKRTKNTGSRLREAGSINSSLMALRNCMEVLKENITNMNNQMNGNGVPHLANANRKMVPYRDSKLTLLFKNYFEGYGKIKMILCINPSAVEFDETINVLKFSDLVKDILVPTSNSDMNFHQSHHSIKSNQHNIEKMSMNVFEQANLALLTSLQQNNYSIMSTPFPPMDIFSPDDDVTIRHLINYLEEFKHKRESLLHETDILKQQFYMKLKDLHEQVDKVMYERNEFKSRLDLKERDQIKSESKIKALEKLINHSNSNNNYNNNPAFHQRTPLSINRIAQFTTPSTNSFDVPPTATRGGISATVPPRGPMLMQSGNSQNEMTPLIGTTNSTGQTISSSAVTTTNSVSNRRIAINNQNQPPIPNTLPPISTPSSYRTKYTTPMRNIQQIQEKLQLQSTSSTPIHGVPVANRRAMIPFGSTNSRRSKSSDVWLDHKMENAPELNTVMQPKMDRKISCSKLELSDAKKSSKYLLTHQQQDADGEIVTNLIKGNICQSPSGGANCVFTDIEVLTCKVQEPVKPVRKRPSEEFVIDDKNVVQDRCAIAIEGHNSVSSSIKSNRVIKKAKV